MSSNTPVIPVIHLNSPNKAETVTALRKACIEIGFFYLNDHAIPNSVLENVFQASKKLFDLPLSEKMTLSDKVMNKGYTTFEEEVLDVSTQIERGDTKEGFYVGKHIPTTSPEYYPEKFRGPNKYPDHNSTSLSNFVKSWTLTFIKYLK